MPININNPLYQQQGNVTSITSAQKSPTSPLRYQTNELSFIRPQGFLDQTFHVLSQTESAPSPFSIVIGRSRISHEETLETLAQRLLPEMEQSLSEFKLIAFQEGAVDGLPARAIEYHWQQQGKPLHQIQILFLHQDEQGERLLIQMTGTSNNPQGMTETERQSFVQCVASVRLRDKSPI